MDLFARMATFVRVVEGQSLSAAARAQRMSLPAVSRQLRALETDLGVSLVVRSTRRLRVTEAGKRFYEHAVRILADVEAARDSVRESKAVTGTLVVSASLTFGSVVVIPRLVKLAQKHPRLVVDLRLEDRFVDLVGESVDVAVRAGSPPPDSTAYVAHPLFSMRRVLVASPSWLKKHGVPVAPAELSTRSCLVQVAASGAVVRWRLARGEEEQTVEASGALRSNAPIALRELARDGGGVAYLPDWLVAGDLADGSLSRVLPDWSSRPIPAWVIYRSELRRTPRLRAFLEALPRSAPGA